MFSLHLAYPADSGMQLRLHALPRSTSELSRDHVLLLFIMIHSCIKFFTEYAILTLPLIGILIQNKCGQLQHLLPVVSLI